MLENSVPVSQDIPAARITAASTITAAAIQTGKIDAGDFLAVNYSVNISNNKAFVTPWNIFNIFWGVFNTLPLK